MMTELENKQEALLRYLNDEFEKKRIPAKYLEEERKLTVLLTWDGFGEKIFGDIAFVPVSEQLEHLLICSMDFEIMDVSGLSEETVIDLLTGTSMMSAAIPLGGFGVQTSERKATEERAAFRNLVYRMQLPLLRSLSEELLRRELRMTFFAAASVLQSSASDLVGLGKGELSREEFLRRL